MLLILAPIILRAARRDFSPRPARLIAPCKHTGRARKARVEFMKLVSSKGLLLRGALSRGSVGDLLYTPSFFFFCVCMQGRLDAVRSGNYAIFRGRVLTACWTRGRRSKKGFSGNDHSFATVRRRATVCGVFSMAVAWRRVVLYRVTAVFSRIKK